MFICSGEEEFCSGALVRKAVCQKLGPGVRNHPGRWTAESRSGPFKEPVHLFLPACQSVQYLSGPDTMLVCVFVCMCGSRQTLRLLNVTRHIQATDPRRRKGKTQRYDGTLQLTGEGGNLIGKICVNWVSLCGPVDNYFLWWLTGCFCFPVRQALAAFNEVWPVSSQWSIKAASTGRMEETDNRYVCIAPWATFGVNTDFFRSSRYWNAQAIPSSLPSLDVCDIRWIE